MGEGDTSGTAKTRGGARRRRRRRRSSATTASETAAGASSSEGRKGDEATTASRAGSAASGGTRTGRKRRRATSSSAKGGTAKTERAAASTSGDRTTSKERSRSAKKRKAQRKRRASRRTGPPVQTKREISAGGVVYRHAEDGIDVVLASRRTRRGDLAWGLAKGGLEGDESMEDAAVREVREETGLQAEIETSLGETRYMYVWEDVRIRKTVHFFLMRHTGGDIDDRDDEMEEIRWFPLERALKRAAYRGERDVLQRAAELLR